MAGVILTRSIYAKKPYYISNMSINIYSLEELCYYIYNNIYIIGTDIVDFGLISYIEKELEEPELAGELQYLKEQDAGLSEIVNTILRYADYYTDDEIAELKEVIDKLDLQNAAERLKSRADSFLSNKRYESAIRNYELIVYGKRDMNLPISFYGNVWHNMGIAYCKMHLFQDGIICFNTAYDLNQNEESLKALVVAKCLQSGVDLDEEQDELTYVTCKEIETIMDHALESPSLFAVKNALKLKEDGQVALYHEAINKIIAGWKKDYRNYVK